MARLCFSAFASVVFGGCRHLSAGVLVGTIRIQDLRERPISKLGIIFCIFWTENNFVNALIPFIGVSASIRGFCWLCEVDRPRRGGRKGQKLIPAFGGRARPAAAPGSADRWPADGRRRPRKCMPLLYLQSPDSPDRRRPDAGRDRELSARRLP